MSAVKLRERPELLRKIDGYPGDLQTRIAPQFITLTFVRTSELIGATWDEFYTEEAVWVISADRIKMRAEHIVPLSSQGVGLVNTLKM